MPRDNDQFPRYEALRKEFVANVSHELRTPLTVIKGYVETLLDGALDDRQRAERYLRTIQKHADQLTNLVDDLLELSQLESHVPERSSQRAEVDVGALLHRARDLLEPGAVRKGQGLSISVAASLGIIEGNPDQLERAVVNLADNAIKYTPEGGHITLGARREGSQVVIEVRDNGIGIPPEDIPRIFERFYRVDRSRSREMGGTGLGLSIVKHIVQSHGGTIEVKSEVGMGSAFVIRLPVGAK